MSSCSHGRALLTLDRRRHRRVGRRRARCGPRRRPGGAATGDGRSPAATGSPERGPGDMPSFGDELTEEQIIAARSKTKPVAPRVSQRRALPRSSGVDPPPPGPGNTPVKITKAFAPRPARTGATSAACRDRRDGAGRTRRVRRARARWSGPGRACACEVVDEVEGDRAAWMSGRKHLHHRSCLHIDESSLAQQPGQRPSDRQVGAGQLGRRMEKVR